MKNIQSWIVKNKIITAILLAAVVLALGLILAFNQVDEESTQELAANQEGNANGSEIANQDDLAIQEIGQVQSTPNNCEQNAPDGYEQRCFRDGCPQGGWFTRNDTGTCDQSETICCRKAISVEGAVNCGDLGGSCSIGGCAANYKAAGACPVAGLTCCVPQQEPGVTIIPDDGGDEEEEPADPIVTEAPTPTPDTKNMCQEEVTCTQCNTPCSEGDPRMCRTCSTEDNSCSFREACGTGDNDPIYKSTCGTGDEFTDETRQQRTEGAQGYVHVKCTGTSVCTGGPNADGLYWCVQDTSPTKAPGEGCSVEYKTNAPCDTKCGAYLKCGSQEEFRACAETSSCSLTTPTPTTAPTPPATGTDTGTLTAVTVTAEPGSCGGHTKIYWTATTANISNGYWLYRGTTADFKPSKDNNIAGNITPNKTAQSPYYDWLSEPGKTYYYRVIASGTQGNTKWSNAAQTLTSLACGSNATLPARGQPPDSFTPTTTVTATPTPTDWMTNCTSSSDRGRGCTCSTNDQCANKWCNGGKCHFAESTTNCPATNKPKACVCETNAQCTSGWCNGGKCN